MNDEKQKQVTFTYYLPEHESEVRTHIEAFTMKSLLWGIDQRCRKQIKHGGEEDINKFADELRDMIWSELDLTKE